MARNLLTDSKIKSLTVPAGKAEVQVSDGENLYLRLKGGKSGNFGKNWVFIYYHPVTKKRVKKSFGSYPLVSLTKARQMADEYRLLLVDKIDPAEYFDKKKSKDNEKSESIFESVFIKWKERKKEEVTEKTLLKYSSIISLYLLPDLGKLPINKIKPQSVMPVLEKIYIAGKHETLRKSIKLLNALLTYAQHSLFLIENNPCSNLMKAFYKLGKGENPYILPEELPELFDKLNDSDIKLKTKYLIEWQLLTMTRPKEAAEAKWKEVDFDKGLWFIPADRMKKRKEHLIPLSHQCLQLLDKLKSLSENSPYIFPSYVKYKKGSMSSQTANSALIRLGYKGKLTAHGMRKIASTYLHGRKIYPDVVELCLSHQINGIRGIYNKAEYLDDRRIALSVWGDYVEQCKKNR
ncbi:tyrosine-type recombinase/integrase [Avibacterium volantium]|uniref:tyrosine-type recombinase/integrase n=1 Tax=Avibacterium TaxID=292486 RepID=UPI0039FC74F1